RRSWRRSRRRPMRSRPRRCSTRSRATASSTRLWCCRPAWCFPPSPRAPAASSSGSRRSSAAWPAWRWSRTATFCSSSAGPVSRRPPAVSRSLTAQLVAQPGVERGVGAGGGFAAAERLAGMEPGAGRDALAHGEPLVAGELGARVLRGEGARRPLQLLRRLDLEARLARLLQRRLEALGALVVLQQLAVAVEAPFQLEDPHPAAGDHLLGRDVQIDAGRIVLVAAFPEQGSGVRLVGALVAREADVAVQAVEAAAHPRDEDEPRHGVLEPVAESAAPGEQGGDDLLVPG